MRPCSSLSSLLLMLSFSALTAPALAHQIWLEPAKDGARLYFGEFGDNLHEVSPGYLDKLTRPTATLVSPSGERPLAAAKQKDAFSIPAQPGKGEALIVVDPEYPASESKEGDKAIRSVWTPAARLAGSLAAQAPKLTLDIVPTGQTGEFQVFFRGKPLPSAELTMTAMSGWSRKQTTDASGKARFTLPWKGTYALLVRHREEVPGARPGANGTETFERASFGTTLTFVTGEGLPSPPAPPAAPPNSPPAPAASPKSAK